MNQCRAISANNLSGRIDYLGKITTIKILYALDLYVKLLSGFIWFTPVVIIKDCIPGA
jgi:hypothetical protein